MLLWLWCRLTAVAPIGPLAWEPQARPLKKKKKSAKKPPKGLGANPRCTPSLRSHPSPGAPHRGGRAFGGSDGPLCSQNVYKAPGVAINHFSEMVFIRLSK